MDWRVEGKERENASEMSRTLKAFNLVVFVAWMALLSLLLYREYAGMPVGKAQALKGMADKVTYWYDIYSGTRKIGFGAYTFEWVGDEVVIKYQQELPVKEGDREKRLIESYRCVSNSSYAIRSFEYSVHFNDETGIRVTGKVDSDVVDFFLESPDKRKTVRTATKGRDIYLPTTIIPAIILKKPVLGAVYTVSMLNMAKLSVDDLRVVVDEIRPVKLGTQVLSYYKLRVGNDILWSNDKGVTVKEEYASGITLYSQTETMAKDSTDKALFDPFSLPFFRSNKILKNAEALNSLRVRIKGFPLLPALYEGSSITMKDDTLLIRKEDPEEVKKRSYPLPSTDQTMGRYLRPDEWVLSEDKTVKANALNMASLEKNDAFMLVRYLNSNLYFTVKTMLLFTASNSLDLFKSAFGDHLQRTVMFASFARAAGVPTRLVGGFVYFDGYFYFHTWPEVWFNKWIPMEPTLSQFPADVTHIPLVEGTLRDMRSITGSLNSVGIEVLEAL